jgi:hypothetical protein
MGKRKHIDSGTFIEEAIDNVRKDRAMASALLIELVKILKQDETKHQHSGPVAAKYLETLQRSNEQLVKLASLINKKESAVADISSIDKSEIYDLINEIEED